MDADRNAVFENVNPAVEQGRWLNQDSLWWTSPLEVSASRKGLDNLYDPRLEDLAEPRLAGYAGAARPPRMSQTEQNVSQPADGPRWRYR